MIDVSLSNLRRAWQDLTAGAIVRLTGAVRPDLPDDDLARLKTQIDACLKGQGGEASARARAADLGRTYLGLDEVGRRRFLGLLAHDYGVERTTVSDGMARLDAEYAHAAPDATARRHAEAVLRRALTPPRSRMLAQFNALPQGVKFLVDLRADLLAVLGEDPDLQALDEDLRDLLASWLDVGFLELRVITWDAPASLLEKLANYEAVHVVRSWQDLRHRLADDRRCYAFFHPQMPDEPLIYVWVALVHGMADNVQTILDERAEPLNPAEADTAVFYSISNAQPGLAGVSFGNFLIKEVVAALSRDFHKLKTYATLSPIPGFMQWLQQSIAEGDPPMSLAEEERLSQALMACGSARDLMTVLSSPIWARDNDIAGALRVPLQRLCAAYLSEVSEQRRARDRVAHFHLSNGARIERINWLADVSATGLSQSAGMMVNYLYRSADIEANHEAYRANGEIRLSSKVKELLKA